MAEGKSGGCHRNYRICVAAAQLKRNGHSARSFLSRMCTGLYYMQLWLAHVTWISGFSFAMINRLYRINGRMSIRPLFLNVTGQNSSWSLIRQHEYHFGITSQYRISQMMHKWLGKYTMKNQVKWWRGEKMQTSAETLALIYQINVCD